MTKDINRIKVVLVEKKKTGKWLAEQIGKDPATVSKWCTNTSQPDLRTLIEIASCLQVDIKTAFFQRVSLWMCLLGISISLDINSFPRS